MILFPFQLLRKLVAATRLPAAPVRPASLLLLVLPALLSTAAFAQTAPASTGQPTSPQPVYTYVEQMPVYRHGRHDALADFIERSRKFPREQWKTQGKVFVSFVITDTGGVRDARVVKGLNPVLDAEALRVVQLLDGQFLPGKQNGRPVNVNFTTVVPFVTK